MKYLVLCTYLYHNIQRQLKESDDYVAKHQKEKAETRAGIEKKHVDKLVKQEVSIIVYT